MTTTQLKVPGTFLAQPRRLSSRGQVEGIGYDFIPTVLEQAVAALGAPFKGLHRLKGKV